MKRDENTLVQFGEQSDARAVMNTTRAAHGAMSPARRASEDVTTPRLKQPVQGKTPRLKELIKGETSRLNEPQGDAGMQASVPRGADGSLVSAAQGPPETELGEPQGRLETELGEPQGGFEPQQSAPQGGDGTLLSSPQGGLRRELSKSQDGAETSACATEGGAEMELRKPPLRVGGQVSEPPSAARVCTCCGQHYSGEARFCPFDGEMLVVATDWNPSADPLLGVEVDGRYVVEFVLGEGGMGRVYQVRHSGLERAFALKALKPELASDKALAARFIQEAKAAASVHSPWVVQITDFGALRSGEPYFVMELLEGRALSQIIQEYGAMPSNITARIACRIAEGLGVAHDAGVIHRDLKPDNVHVADAESANPLVKVLDFGLAKVAGASKLTRDGMVFGTPHYMSPEQASGEPLDHRVDVYSLGVVMYEMVAGKTPFEAETFMGVLTQHIHVMPRPPSARLGGEALGALEDIILRCLAKQPSQRFSSMSELASALAAVVDPPSALARSAIAETVAKPLMLPVESSEGAPARGELPCRASPLRSLMSRVRGKRDASGRTDGKRAAEALIVGPAIADAKGRLLLGAAALGSAALIYVAASMFVGPENPEQATTRVPLTDAQLVSSASASPIQEAASEPVEPTQLERVTSLSTGPKSDTGLEPVADRDPVAPAKPKKRPNRSRTSRPPKRPIAPAQVVSAARPATQPSAQPPQELPPEAKMPSLSGGDIIDPWAQ